MASFMNDEPNPEVRCSWRRSSSCQRPSNPEGFTSQFEKMAVRSSSDHSYSTPHIKCSSCRP